MRAFRSPTRPGRTIVSFRAARNSGPKKPPRPVRCNRVYFARFKLSHGVAFRPIAGRMSTQWDKRPDGSSSVSIAR